MKKNKYKSLPKFRSLDELVEFFDSRDMAEYLNGKPEVHFDVDIKKSRHLLPVDSELAKKLTEIAKLRQVSFEELVDTLLREKIQEEN